MKMTIGRKLAIGFGGLVLLILIVGAISYSSLFRILDKVEKADDANRLVKQMLEARRAEKNFMLTDDKAYIDKNAEILATITKQTDETKAKFKQQIDKDQMDQMTRQVRKYETAFGSYVDLDNKKDLSMEVMRANARETLVHLDDIRQDQKKQLAERRKEAAAFQDDKIIKSDDANRMIKWFLEARKNEKEFIISNGKKEWMDNHNDLMSRILALAADLKSQFKLAKNVEQIDQAVVALKAYEAAWKKFAGMIQQKNTTMTEMTMTEMRANARETLVHLDDIRQDQKKQLAERRKEAAAFQDDKIIKSDDANRMIKWFLEARKNEKEFIISNGKKEWMDNHNDLMSRILALAADLKSQFKLAKNVEQIDQAIAAVKTYNAAFDKFAGLMKTQDDGEKLMVQAAQEAQEVCKAVHANQKSEAQSIFSNITLILIISVLIAILAGITAGIVITRVITIPVRQLVSTSQTVADGDLTRDVEVKTGDEVGMLAVAFQQMVESLRGLAVEAQNAAEKVSATSQELSSSAQEMNATTEEVSSTVQQIATGSSKQAEATETTSKVIEDISTTIKENASAAQSASAASLEAIEKAQTGKNATQRTSEKMEQIDSVINKSVGFVRDLKDRSQQISKIVDVITGFANQTNLLSLNAAIEAARAGESGRGFAVVAEEVRKLAEDSKKSAEEIADLIAEIQAETEKTVISIDSGSKEVTEGMEVVKETGVALEEIIKGVEEAGAMSQQVASASQQMVEGIEKIVKAMEEISTTAEENASAVQEVSASTEEQTASMEQMASSAQELSDMAVKLAELTAKFKVGGDKDVRR